MFLAMFNSEETANDARSKKYRLHGKDLLERWHVCEGVYRRTASRTNQSMPPYYSALSYGQANLTVEATLMPLKSHASSLLLEARGGGVVSAMTLEDFFLLIELGKRITVTNRLRNGKEVSSIGVINSEI
jgi:hypothetical protein